ncbi:MAG: restriction endonuclease subunit S, partial [Candidatus Thiodiazotropha sp.]
MEYNKYSTYQDTYSKWLPSIPKSWQYVRLGQFFSERNEKVSDKDYPPLSVTMNGIVPQLETAAKTDAGDNRKKVCKGDFVINSRSDRKGSSGLSTLDGSVSLISIVLKPNGLDGAYIHHLLRSKWFQEEFYRFGKGIVDDLWSTKYSDMKSINIPIPSLNEQQAISTFLDRETTRIDALIEKKQRLIELLKEKRQAVITQAVTKGLDP